LEGGHLRAGVFDADADERPAQRVRLPRPLRAGEGDAARGANAFDQNRGRLVVGVLRDELALKSALKDGLTEF
jgi:hypothetical protein